MSALAKNAINNASNFGKEQVEKLLKQDNDTFLSIVICILTIIIIFIIIIYVILQISKKRDNVKDFERKYKIYESNTKLESYISAKDDLTGQHTFKYPTRNGDKDGKRTGRLCDYFIASSYNSCCSGDFKDDYVDVEALKNAIKQGARVLDFQIFCINGDLIVSASNNETEFMKGTYNYLPLRGINGVFDIINKYAFSDFCNNKKDPLFLNLRIQSEKTDIYDRLTELCIGVFENKLLSTIYGYEQIRSGIDILKTPIANFYEKIIIICDQKNKNFRNTSFHELVNLSPQTDDGPLVAYKNYEVNFAEESDTIIEQSKNKIVMVYPDNTNINDNRDPINLFNMGCSIIFMNYQKLDTNLKTYLSHFGQAQEYNKIGFQAFAFLLKIETLRPYYKKKEIKNKCNDAYNPLTNKMIIEIITLYNDIKYGYRIEIPKSYYSLYPDKNRSIQEISGNNVDLCFRMIDSEDTICIDMNGQSVVAATGAAATGAAVSSSGYPKVTIYNGSDLDGNACYGRIGSCYKKLNIKKQYKSGRGDFGIELESDYYNLQLDEEGKSISLFKKGTIDEDCTPCSTSDALINNRQLHYYMDVYDTNLEELIFEKYLAY